MKIPVVMNVEVIMRNNTSFQNLFWRVYLSTPWK